MHFLRILCALSMIAASLASKCAVRGRWQIEFRDVHAYMDTDGQSCDNMSKCDTYIKILVDDTEVFRTKTVYNNNAPHFDQISNIDICEDAKIVIEMWDEDMALQGNDDLMGRWGPKTVTKLGQVPILQGKKWHRGFQNLIKARSYWTRFRS